MLANDAVSVVDIPRHMMDDKALLHKPGEPASQESNVSAASSVFSAPGLLPSSSNVSTSTVADTEVASSAPHHPPSQKQPAQPAIPSSSTQARSQNAQFASPQVNAVPATRTGDTAASPTSPKVPLLSQGSKRTADGTIKGSDAFVHSQVAPAAHKRTKSIEQGASRIGELSAQLRTRLSYAMVKVQNGWEKRSIDDLEEETSQRGSPMPIQGRTEDGRPVWGSPPDVARRRRPSAVSDASDRIMLSPNGRSPPTMANGTQSSYWRPATSQFPYQPSTSSVSTAAVSNGSVLAPPVEISPQRRRRSSATFVPPSLHSAVQRKHQSDLGAAPRTPIAASVPRPGILRMPSQQAEKDAVDMLLFLNSPNNSGRFPATNMESHLRSGPAHVEAPSRRVMFEDPISKNQPPDAQRGYSNVRNPAMHPKDTSRR